MKQNIEVISQMNDEIEALFESSPGIEATFNHAVTEVASAFDSLQINLLENSVLDSTDVSAERSTFLGDETMQLNETKRVDQEMDAVSEVGRDGKGMTTIEEDGLKSREVTTKDFIENEPSSNDGDKWKSQSTMSDDGASGKICEIKPYDESNLAAEEFFMEINVNECEEPYDFSVLEGNKVKTEQRNSEKPMMALHGEKRDTEENIGKSMIGERVKKLADCDDKYFATCVDDKDYNEQFSRKIESLDILIEKENQQRWSSKRTQRSTKQICMPRNEKVKDPEDLSSSVCSVVSESSGVYSFDHDDNHQYVTDPTPQRNAFNSMINGKERSLSMEVSVSMETVDGETTVTDDESLIGATRGPRPADVFTRQRATFYHDLQRDVKCIEDENMTDFEKKEQVEANRIDEDKSKFGMPLLQYEGLDVIEDKSRKMPAAKEYSQQLIFHRKEGEEEGKIVVDDEDRYYVIIGLLDDDKYLRDKEEDREPNEMNINVIEKLPLQEMACYEILDDDAIQQGNVDGTDNNSIVSQNKPTETEIAQNTPAKTEWNELSKEENTLSGDLMSTDELDFSELVRRLEFASRNDYSKQDCNSLASTGPNINVIPPTPRKGSISSSIIYDIESLTNQSSSFDLPDINIIPATPRRSSFNGEDATPSESQNAKKTLDDITLEPGSPENAYECRTKPSYMRSASVPAQAPCINIIPPTPRRQSLDLSSAEVSFPVIQVIPPTPRRQSLGSENDEPIATAYINGAIESENINDEPSQPSLLSSFPSPLIPRVLNWLEKSIFEDWITPVDSALEDVAVIGDAVWENKQANTEHQKEDKQKINKEDANCFGNKEQLGHHRNQKPCKREIEPEMFEMMINDVASEWPNLDTLENFAPSSTVAFKDEIDNEDGDGDDDDGGYHLDEVDFESIGRHRKGNIGHEGGKEEEKGDLGIEPVADVVVEKEVFDGQTNVELKKQPEQIMDRFKSVEAPSKMLFESNASVFDDSVDVSDESTGSRKATREMERGLEIQSKKSPHHTENESKVASLFEGLCTEAETTARNELPEFFERAKETVNGAFKNNSTFADIENQLKEIDAQKHALKQRKDSGATEETTFGVTCLNDLIDNETQEAMAAGMDSFYARISSCLKSMNNINGLLVDGSELNDGKEDPVNQLRVIITLSEYSKHLCL